MKTIESFKSSQISNQEIKTINGGFIAPLLIYVKDKTVEFFQNLHNEPANVGGAATNGAVSVIK